MENSENRCPEILELPKLHSADKSPLVKPSQPRVAFQKVSLEVSHSFFFFFM
jgi:hypothetical protein